MAGPGGNPVMPDDTKPKHAPIKAPQTPIEQFGYQGMRARLFRAAQPSVAGEGLGRRGVGYQATEDPLFETGPGLRRR